MSASLSITFRRSESDLPGGLPKDVTLELLDYCSSAAIASATVNITGPGGYSYSGASDSLGKLALGILPPGHYTLGITSPGYIPSADDLLANDGFDV